MENNINKIDDSKLNEILTVSATPHIRSANTSSKIMRDVVIALVPALAASFYFFGIRALIVTLVSVITAVLSELIFQKITKKPVTITDLSAVVTGILVAYNVPVNIPLYMVAFGSLFAIIVVKQLFGGIGSNFMNPALAGRAAIMASWPLEMGSFTAPHAKLGVDAVTVATPLAGGEVTLMDAFVGNMPGTIGEVSAVCLLIGAGYLLLKKVISIRIPLLYILTTVVMLFLVGIPANELLNQVLYGGLILGAFFMATDYATAPVSKKGQIIFAIGCGIITACIRKFGSLPEGVSYSILVMNIATPLIDKLTTPKSYGRGGKK
ncbi:RnfABCDGE type electron transport complex subunit D [Miniphocaeibacter massiliensis]|uniref:RnfABCDGE type electron transport complex subunit D n=1 Tax=Miniphocaeibacter massiliensis TaxID=2041841 RepID=UPI000C1C7181|nr:RnfABCDGE type electron transport complex subunit D [Miniphocaeibacter massiliensis]